MPNEQTVFFIFLGAILERVGGRGKGTGGVFKRALKYHRIFGWGRENFFSFPSSSSGA